MNGSENKGKDAFLTAQQKRIDTAKAKMAARQELLRERERRETERLYRLVGEVCCEARKRTEFGPVIKERLETCSDEGARAFLQQKGLI